MQSWIYGDPEYWRSSDTDVDHKHAKLTSMLALGGQRPSVYKCALVGTHCLNLRLVDVPLRCGIRSGVKPMDLDVMLWIPPCKRDGPHVFDFSRNQFVVDKFPFDGDNILDVVYTFYYQPQKDASTRWACPNALVASITSHNASCWFGDILVIKTNTKGGCCSIINVEEDEISVIRDILKCLIHSPSNAMSPNIIPSTSAALRTVFKWNAYVERIGNDNMLYGSEIYRIREIMEYISGYCDFLTLVHLSNCDRHLRVICQYVMRSRLRMFLRDYIPVESLPRFFEIMQETTSFVTGALLHSILRASADTIQRCRPTQLDIVVANRGGSGMAKWERFLHGLGWTIFREADCNGIYQDVAVRSVVRYQPGNLLASIYLLESKTDDILPIILSAPYTAMMDVLSGSRIYCFYPDLLVRGENISTSRFITGGRRADGLRPCNYGLRTYKSTALWADYNRMCGEHCPALLRTVKGLPGVCVMKWGGIHGLLDIHPSDASASDGFEHQPYGWKLAGPCDNSICPYFGRGLSLDLYDYDNDP
ncbi:hypothetical protein BDN70DRAFT_900401 [Pholiota conissans]|uniref:Uncharacterized protein n=1 Tax=Pholiota conissans TaxID=109636 RepID=A0A9P5YMR1_9AGAR|nr:hypothetical protein BDN70DRAFT_900401 [Pholiota conissans]